MHQKQKNIYEMFPLDTETWERGQAWTLWKSLIIVAGFIKTNKVETSSAWRTVEEVIKDFK